jgi:hypothetical protein
MGKWLRHAHNLSDLRGIVFAMLLRYRYIHIYHAGCHVKMTYSGRHYVIHPCPGHVSGQSLRVLVRFCNQLNKDIEFLHETKGASS